MPNLPSSTPHHTHTQENLPQNTHKQTHTLKCHKLQQFFVASNCPNTYKYYSNQFCVYLSLSFSNRTETQPPNHNPQNTQPVCARSSFASQLNDFEIRKGKKIGVTISFNNHRLFVGNIPKNRDHDELIEEFTKHARKSNHHQNTYKTKISENKNPTTNTTPTPGKQPTKSNYKPNKPKKPNSSRTAYHSH